MSSKRPMNWAETAYAEYLKNSLAASKLSSDVLTTQQPPPRLSKLISDSIPLPTATVKPSTQALGNIGGELQVHRKQVATPRIMNPDSKYNLWSVVMRLPYPSPSVDLSPTAPPFYPTPYPATGHPGPSMNHQTHPEGGGATLGSGIRAMGELEEAERYRGVGVGGMQGPVPVRIHTSNQSSNAANLAQSPFDEGPAQTYLRLGGRYITPPYMDPIPAGPSAAFLNQSRVSSPPTPRTYSTHDDFKPYQDTPSSYQEHSRNNSYLTATSVPSTIPATDVADEENGVERINIPTYNDAFYDLSRVSPPQKKHYLPTDALLPYHPQSSISPPTEQPQSDALTTYQKHTEKTSQLIVTSAARIYLDNYEAWPPKNTKYTPTHELLELHGILRRQLQNQPGQNYLGTGKNPRHEANLPDHENCTLFLTGIPVGTTIAEIFAVIDVGAVYCLHVNPANGHFFNMAAKLSFMTPEAAARFMSKIHSQEGIWIRGMRLIGRYNREGDRRNLQRLSRVLVIEGPEVMMTIQYWIKYFSQICVFRLEAAEFIPHGEPGRALLEFRFARVDGQAQACLRAIQLQDEFRGVIKVIYGCDTCGPAVEGNEF